MLMKMISLIISDIDEIPNLENINFKIKNNLLLFNQKMCYYKFNLYQKNYNWVALEHVKKKINKSSMVRDVKPKKYPLWRLDNFFQKINTHNIKFIENGGWHFSYLNTPELIEQKLKSYTHHREYDLNPIGLENIANRIKNRESVYNLSIDKRTNKFTSGVKLEILDENELPDYLMYNKNKFKDWLE